MQNNNYINKKQLLSEFGISKATFYRFIKRQVITRVNCLLNYKTIWLSLIFIQCYFISFSQEKGKEPFEYIRWPRNPVTGIIDKLHFYDSLTRQPVKVVDLIDMNPYGKFKEKVVDTLSGYGTLVFELATPKSQIDSFRLISSQFYPNSIDLEPFQLSSRYNFSRESQNYIAVLYSLTTWNKYQKEISSHTTAFVFNRTGDLMHRVNHIDVNSWNPLVTQDGKYLFFLSGGPESNAEESYLPHSFFVFDLKNRQMIYKDSIGSDLGAGLLEGKLFFVPNTFKYGYNEYRVFDFYNNIVYNKVFTMKESGGLYEKNIDHMKFKNSRTKEVITLYYEKDFNKGIIVEK